METQNQPFSLREKLEKPLIVVDSVISKFAKEIGAHVLANYRDGVNRTVYYRTKRVVKYIHLSLVLDKEEKYSDIKYRIYVSAYKIRVPFLNFWNMRFAYYEHKRNSGYYQKMGIIMAPIDIDELTSLLYKGHNVLEQVSL